MPCGYVRAAELHSRYVAMVRPCFVKKKMSPVAGVDRKAGGNEVFLLARVVEQVLQKRLKAADLRRLDVEFDDIVHGHGDDSFSRDEIG